MKATKPLTVGDLRRALEGVPDETPVELCAHFYDRESDDGVDVEACLHEARVNPGLPIVLFGDSDESPTGLPDGPIEFTSGPGGQKEGA